ncbi:putative beta-glucosidase precursor [Aspergillus japonicus CBS 114.51]|uniref:beta-glucosidase n=1 Tax=Aspergillus japonicus CBS 114.51 TaxID=1448312 RepID=A0A8T8X1A6_ASPJA|nr:putative beta-glucosidase precursor [Aspergillus japonicus CBS 114.51]RAH81927.1 putative beta-glucosidase precursor [Aspergillus japonicus CBS 114.51]
MAFNAPSSTVDQLLQSLTLEEKVALLAGKNMWETANIDRLHIPSLKMTDGPAGARGSKWTYGSLTTWIPCGVSLAATFDPALVEKVGTVLGQETRRKGCQVLLAPTMNLSRSPLGGRNFEGYGEDPYLIGVMATAMIRGIQSQGVGACMKHFILNDTETRRFNVDQTIDERTLREVYMKPFTMAARDAAPWTAMVSYPKINGLHADLSPDILPRLLREELQYDRLVMSDWGGLNSTVESLLATTDLEMPGPPVRRGQRLLAAIHDGRIDLATHVDPSVRRVLQLLEQTGLLKSSDPTDVSSEQTNDDPAFHQIAREAAQSGLVLLKNADVLPLQPSRLRKIAIIGPNARKPTAGGAGSAAVNPFYITTPEECLRNAIQAANPDTKVTYRSGIGGSLRPPLLGNKLTVPDGSLQGLQVSFFAGHTFGGSVVATSLWDDSLIYLMSDGDIPAALEGRPYSYQASGIVTPSESGRYTWSLANTGKAKLFLDDELLIDNSEWSVVTGGFLGCSSEDRIASIHLEGGRAYRLRVDNVVTLPLVDAFDNTLFPRISGVRVGLALERDETLMLEQAVASAREADVAVVVVGHNKDSEGEGGDRAHMQLPGRTDELVAAVCAANPNTIVVVQAASAVTMPWVDAAAGIVMAWYQGQENGQALAQALLGHCNFSGKLPITFPQRLEDHGSHAWFPGEAAQDRNTFGEEVLVGYRYLDIQGIPPLWSFGFGLSGTMSVSSPEIRVSIHARVLNVGGCDGQEVVQVYVAPSAQIEEMGLVGYSRTLAGFSKVIVPAGESRQVTISIPGSELRWYDAKTGQWRLDAGMYKCWVGRSLYESELTTVVMECTTPVACLNCRDKHLKCDGNLAGCTRCQSLSLPCHFIPSRRGRKCRPALPASSILSLASPASSIPMVQLNEQQLQPHEQQQSKEQDLQQFASFRGREQGLQLISLYYLHFHQAHPFLPPMETLLESNPPSYLLDILDFTSLHYLSSQFFHDSSKILLLAVQAAELSVEKTQAFLLLAIVQHGRQQAHEARSCLGQALQCALELGLHRREASDALGIDAPLRAESLRRTWWEIFVVDVLLAAVQADGYLQFEMRETPEVPLPCGPEEYQPGCIMSPLLPTLGDLEHNSLFCGDVEFSPCAYRIEAAMMLRKCLRAGETHVTQEMLDVLSAAITAWFHRLPSSQRPILQANGILDEAMMQAVMLMHCASIYLHFPRSCLLAFLPITGRVLCSSPPALITTSPDPQLHTAKVAESAVQLSRLASLSPSVIDHSPFFGCTLVISSVIHVALMLSDGLQPPGPRQQYLALNLGVLKSMGETWPIAASAMQRIRQAVIEVHTAISCDTRPLLDVFSPSTSD